MRILRSSGAARVAALLLFAVFVFLPTQSGRAQQAQPKPETFEKLEIATKSGVHVFDIEFADTDYKRRVGLMFRKELPQGQGMLFDFDRERGVAMWMQNTYVSLDMIFIRADGTIANIAQFTTPLSEATILSDGPVKGVLEVVAGTALRLGIAPGDKVSHRIFDKK
ncbi:MAG: DUF192 domain-containing protein [Xanthobacteraceae bacterium]|nr:DUF192 domain-containing protein [Xanthobacteraceae bacterium]QYK46143.1 MAG: DUF192 domain-containing protein [Xanthobacteraceae bacterium]HMN51510.1 DUF192 domain-containing protein [Xanthobacteraceae bacterium]